MSPLWLVVLALALLSPAVATPLEELRLRCGGRRDAKDCLMSSLASYVDNVADPGGDVDLWTGLRLTKEVVAHDEDEVSRHQQRDVDSEEENDEDDVEGGTSEVLLGRVVADKVWGVAQGRALVWSVANGVEVHVAPAKDGAGITLSLAETDTQEDEG